MKTILSVLAEIYAALADVFTPRLLTPEDCRLDVPAWKQGKPDVPKTRRREGWQPLRPGASTLYRESDKRTLEWEVANTLGDLKPEGNPTLTDADVTELMQRGVDVDAAMTYKPLFAAGLSAQAALNEKPDGYGLRTIQSMWAAFNAAAGTSQPLPRNLKRGKR